MRKKIFALLSMIVACFTVTAAGCKSDNGDNGGSKGNTEQKTYTVTFDSAGGTEIKSVTAKEGALIAEPDAPARTSFDKQYIFTGWFYEGELWNFDADTVSGNITLTASWVLSEEYTKFYPPKS